MTQRQNDCACSAILCAVCEWTLEGDNEASFSPNQLSHQWTELSFIIYKDIGISTEMLQE